MPRYRPAEPGDRKPEVAADRSALSIPEPVGTRIHYSIRDALLIVAAATQRQGTAGHGQLCELPTPLGH